MWKYGPGWSLTEVTLRQKPGVEDCKGGGYADMSNNPSFVRGGLPDLSRAIKAEMHDAAVCVEYDDERDH